MEFWWNKRNGRRMCVYVSIFFICLISVFLGINGVQISFSETEIGSVLNHKANDNQLQNLEKLKTWEMAKEKKGNMGGARMLLGGPGSSPPRCNYKCGRCRPCRPVHVSVPPGRPVTTEYYPEAWRCKCGNRLYMP